MTTSAPRPLSAHRPSERPPRRHVVITGTGRTGTTFLVALFTHLGLDTGLLPDEVEANTDAIAAQGSSGTSRATTRRTS